MNYSNSIFLLLLLTFIFQTACESSSRAEKKPAQISTETRNADYNVDSDRQPSATPPIESKPKPTVKKTPPKIANAVCGNPSKHCANKDFQFGEWELPFQLPARIVPNKNYKSAPFYAVILEKYEEGCDDLDVNPAIEPIRIKLQKRFPANKVFAEYSCPNLAAVSYDFAGKLDAAGETVLYMDYIAVYAGDSAEEAEKMRDELSAEFPKAVVKKMTANFASIEQ